MSITVIDIFFQYENRSLQYDCVSGTFSLHLTHRKVTAIIDITVENNSRKEEKKMRNNRSSEDYLETILLLSKKLPVVRSVDIATELNFSKPSVSVAMKHLRENECIEVSSAGFITLTEKGKQIASSVYERHTVLSDWLISLGVSPETAVNDACEMEHQISDESFQAMKEFIKKHTSE